MSPDADCREVKAIFAPEENKGAVDEDEPKDGSEEEAGAADDGTED